MAKILFIYPNFEGYPIIPLGISVLSSVLKMNNHEVELFDITFMVGENKDQVAREKTNVVKLTDTDSFWRKENLSLTEIFQRLKNKIDCFTPDLISFSIVENNYYFSKICFEFIKKNFDIPILAGGIFPTVGKEFFLEDKNVDFVCVGEGEKCIVDLCERIEKRKSFENVPNLITKKNENCIFADYYDWNPFVVQDWDIFDKRHLYKPYNGKIYKSGFFEASRGCSFKCNYCNNHVYQNIFKHLKNYHREKQLEFVIEEIRILKDKYSLEFIFFNDENFLMMSKSRFGKFCIEYKEKIDLPFFIATKAETLLNTQRLEKLKDINCAGIGIGVEVGNQDIRRNLLNKHTSNNIYENAFSNLNKLELRSTAYVMMGLPGETEKNILDTIEFCKKIKPSSLALSIFAPYHKTKLKDICVKEGLIEDRIYDNISVNYDSILDFNTIQKEKFLELYYNFNNLVYGA